MSKNKTATVSELQEEIAAEVESTKALDIPDIDQIPARVVSLFDQLTAETKNAVRLAYQIGKNLAYARKMLAKDFKVWLTENIYPTIGERQVRRYMRLAGKTKDGRTHWKIISDGELNNKFGNLDSQFTYGIEGCLKYLATVVGKPGKKSSKPEAKKLKVKKDDVLKVLKEHKLSEDTFAKVLKELGYQISEPTEKKTGKKKAK